MGMGHRIQTGYPMTTTSEPQFPKTPAACADFLRNFNQWRRGDDTIPQPDPTQIGLAITMAAELIDTQPSEGPFTNQQKNMILRDMVNMFQEQFDQIDTLLGLPVNDCSPSDINRTLAAITTLLPNRIDHPLTDNKTQSVIQRGYKITGYTLTHETGGKCIVDMGAVRWFDDGEKFFSMMHPPEAELSNAIHQWPLMGYGRVAIGGARQPDGTSALLYMNMGETREINADTTDLFPIGTHADPSKTLACIFFKDSAAIQQTIDVLHEMQAELEDEVSCKCHKLGDFDGKTHHPLCDHFDSAKGGAA